MVPDCRKHAALRFKSRYVALRRQLSVTLAFRGGAFASQDAMSLS